MFVQLIINILHFVYVLFVMITPFTNSARLLFLHVLMMPLMLAHWYTNSNICSLTEFEMYFSSNKSLNNCFTCKFIYPIYNFSQNYQRYIIFSYVVVAILWFISLYKLCHLYQNGEITSFRDLVTGGY